MFRSRQRCARFGVAILAGFGLLTGHAKEPVMSETKTNCIGRFLVDIPSDAEVNGQSYEFMFGRIESERKNIDANTFSEIMTQREAEIKSKKIKDIYQLSKTIVPSPDSRIFLASRTAFGNLGYGFDAYRLEKNVLFSITQTGFAPDKIDSVTSRLQNNLLAHLSARQPDEVPSVPGFCIKDGFIADDGTQKQREDAGMSFRFSRWPDIVITVSTSTVSKTGEKTLLQRLDSRAVPPVYAPLMGQIKTLRRGVHEVHGRKGEEILELLPTDEGIKQHSFRWEAAGNIDNVLSPDLVVEFESGTPLNGHPRRPSLSDADAIKLFDSIVNSIRLRPTGPAKVSSIDSPPQLPLGGLAVTGAICPQTGWWQCKEAGNLDGERRRFFKAGEAIPPAVLLGDANIWQTIRGQRPSHSINTVWSLVAYEQEKTVAPIQEMTSGDTSGLTSQEQPEDSAKPSDEPQA